MYKMRRTVWAAGSPVLFGRSRGFSGPHDKHRSRCSKIKKEENSAMKHNVKRMLAFVLAFAMVLSCFNGLTVKAQAAAIDEVTVETSGDSVVSGNGFISREFSVADGKLSTTEINNKRAEKIFVPGEGSEEFIIRVTKAGGTVAPSVPALDRTGWTAVADSYHNASGPSDGPGQNLLDGNLDSIWHTNYGGGTGD